MIEVKKNKKGVALQKPNNTQHKFPYEWTLKDANFTKDKGTVFSCFACGGGSTMGYKLAGFDVLGCNEIDPKMIEAYKTNHKPKYAYLEPIQTFKLRKDLAKELQPKVVVAENVKGLLMGSAKEYVRNIYRDFDKAGYYCQHWLLNASKMGVPQRRERVFFICLRKDLAKDFLYFKDMFTEVPKIDIEFKEKPILFKDIIDMKGRDLSENMKKVWEYRSYGDSAMQQGSERLNGKSTYFSQSFLYKDKTPGTLTSHEDSQVLFDAPKYTSKDEACKIGSYPLDYNFGKKKPHYMIGMSVPPVMTAQIATKIYEQWLSKLLT